MEDYAAKMLLKTDAALRDYVTSHAQYREGAVVAALDELRRRGQPAPEEEALRPGLEATLAVAAERVAAEEAETARLYAIFKPDSDDGPVLYSPITIVLFSLPTLLVGGVLLCMNLFRLGKKKAMLGLGLFIIVYGFGGSLLISKAVLGLGLSAMWGTMFLNISAALIYVLWFWPRYVGTLPFRNRSVLAPVVVCLLLMWGVNQLKPYLLKQQPPEVRREMERMMSR